jgi:hypothetical protein
MPHWTPFQPDIHGRLILRPKESHFFAQGLNPLPVYAVELSMLVPMLALAVQRVDGRLRLVALTGFHQDLNLLIGPKGGWNGYMMPLAIRLYPFQPLWHEQQEKYVLALDDKSALLGEYGDGEMLLTPQGKVTPRLKQIQKLFQHAMKGQPEIDGAMTQLMTARLLQPWNHQAHPLAVDGEIFSASLGPLLKGIYQEKVPLTPMALRIAFALVHSAPNIIKLKKLLLHRIPKNGKQLELGDPLSTPNADNTLQFDFSTLKPQNP